MPSPFESIDRFKDRTKELAAMEEWFERRDDPRALLVHGRRRVGKSWLFRAFAHHREADIFVASTSGGMRGRIAVGSAPPATIRPWMDVRLRRT